MEREDKILKSFFNYVEGIKDVVIKNLILSIQDNKISIDASAVPQLSSLINASIDEAYHRGQSTFLREMEGLTLVSPEQKVKLASKKN